MPAERFDFHNSKGLQLAALLDRPEVPPRAVALFAHCFTCGKQNRAARHIADGLKERGIAAADYTVAARRGYFDVRDAITDGSTGSRSS